MFDRNKHGVWVYYRARLEALVSLGMLIGSLHPAPAALSGPRISVTASPCVRAAGGRRPCHVLRGCGSPAGCEGVGRTRLSAALSGPRFAQPGWA
jgi:hypothetical protein